MLLDQKNIVIPCRGTARLDDVRGVTLRVVRGSVWITQSDSREDVSLDAGESFCITRSGPTLVAACHDAPLSEIVGAMLTVNAGAYSFEAANARHEHEYHVWEDVKLPEGKVLIPGVITHASNIVEHPALIAERIIRYAERVGRERVIAGADCGFSSQASYQPEVHPTVMWAKFRAMAEGARLATTQLWDASRR